MPSMKEEDGKNGYSTTDKTAYGKLLRANSATGHQDREENERIIVELERLDTRGRTLTPEEENLDELMTLLIRDFEGSQYPLGHAEPLEAVRILMKNRGLRQRELVPFLDRAAWFRMC